MVIDKNEFLLLLKEIADKITPLKPSRDEILSYEKYFETKYTFREEDDKTYLIIYMTLKYDTAVMVYIEYYFSVNGVYMSGFDVIAGKNKKDLLCFIPYIVEQLALNNNDFRYEAYQQYRKLIEQAKNHAQESFYQSFKSLSSEIDKKEQVSISAPVHLYLYIEDVGTNYILSLKIGRTNKTYIVKDVRALLNGIKKNETKSFGKDLTIILNINSFDKVSQNLINLLSGFSFVELSTNTRNISLKNNDLLTKVINIYKDEIIYFNSIEYFVRLNEVKVMIKVDKHYVLSAIFPDNYEYLKGSSCLIDNHAMIIDKIKADDNFISLINLIIASDFPCIENHLDDFKYSIVLRYPNLFMFDEAVADDFTFEAMVIRVYFDIEKETINYHKELFDINGIKIDENELNPYNKAQYVRFKHLLNAYGFNDENKLDNPSAVWNFLSSDFTELKKVAEIYLSESLKKKKATTFNAPQIQVGSSKQGSMLDVFIEDSIYSEEELAAIYSAIKHKKKYIFLKDNMINLEDESAMEFMRHVDEYSLMEDKGIITYRSLPVYYAFKSLDGVKGIKLDNKVKEILTNIKEFKNSDVEVPAINGTLRDYQVDGVKWLSILYQNQLCGVLADDMGLGKTIEIISFLKGIKEKKPILIVSPKSLIFNWMNEFAKFDPTAKVVAIYGNKKDREKIINKISINKKVIYITSYDSLRQDETLFKNKEFEIMILDEAQAIKNSKAKKTITVSHINSNVRFVLTGTPIENSIMDLWSIFNFLMPGYLSDALSFKDSYEDFEDEFKERVKKKVAPFILRRNKKDVLKDLPPKYEVVMSCEMNNEQRKLYEAMRMQAKNTLNNEGKNVFDIFYLLTRLRQICIEPSLFIDNYHDGSGKMDELKDIIKDKIEDGHRILIFSQFVKALEIVESILKSEDIMYLKITGKTEGEDRVNITNEFNNNRKYKIVLISLKAGGTGLNLVGADTVIHLDPWWNVAAQDQATDRAYRIGQDKNVEVIKLICENSIEQRVVELQNYKKELIASLISDDESSITNLSIDDIKYMLK